jgi:membrane protease subunit HflC
MNKLNTIGVLVVLAVITFFSFTFSVKETELAIKTSLGKVERTDYKPGLYFKIPLYNKVYKFDSRILTLDSAPERMLTSEKKNVSVDSFIKWKIVDVENFYRSTSGDLRRAMALLSQFTRKALLDEFGKRTVSQVISGERKELMRDIQKFSNVQAVDLGIEVIDVRVKKVDFPKEVSSAVYRRMEKERETVATQFRSQGKEEAQFIQADAERQKEIIVATAKSKAEQIRGEGDGLAAKIYAMTYNQDKEFYSFYRSLEAYKQSFSNQNDLLVINPNTSFFKYLNDPLGNKN